MNDVLQCAGCDDPIDPLEDEVALHEGRRYHVHCAPEPFTIEDDHVQPAST